MAGHRGRLAGQNTEIGRQVENPLPAVCRPRKTGHGGRLLPAIFSVVAGDKNLTNLRKLDGVRPRWPARGRLVYIENFDDDLST